MSSHETEKEKEKFHSTVSESTLDCARAKERRRKKSQFKHPDIAQSYHAVKTISYVTNIRSIA